MIVKIIFSMYKNLTDLLTKYYFKQNLPMYYLINYTSELTNFLFLELIEAAPTLIFRCYLVKSRIFKLMGIWKQLDLIFSRVFKSVIYVVKVSNLCPSYASGISGISILDRYFAICMRNVANFEDG